MDTSLVEHLKVEKKRLLKIVGSIDLLVAEFEPRVVEYQTFPLDISKPEAPQIDLAEIPEGERLSLEQLKKVIDFINNLFDVNITTKSTDQKTGAARAIYLKYAQKYTKNTLIEIAHCVNIKDLTVLTATQRYDARVKIKGIYRDMAQKFADNIKDLKL